MLVKLIDGFEIEVNENAFDDMRAVDALCDMIEGDPFAISKISNLLFSSSEKKRLYKHLENSEGRVELVKFMPCINEIMNLLGDAEKK